MKGAYINRGLPRVSLASFFALHHDLLPPAFVLQSRFLSGDLTSRWVFLDWEVQVTLIHALKARGGKRGVASLCIGGGEATALAIELA